jgi:hypothetical protein
MLSSGLLKCSVVHNHQILLVNSYRNDLYLAWSYEYLIRLKENNKVKVTVLDVSGACVDKQMLLLPRIWRKLSKVRDDRRIKSLFSVANEVIIARFPRKIGSLREIVSLGDLKTSLIKNPHITVVSESDYKKRSVHSTYSTEIGTVEYGGLKTWTRRMQLGISFSQAEYLVNRELNSRSYCQVVTGNSRLVNAAGAMSAAQICGIQTLVLERGSRPGMLDTYSISPHSFSERFQHSQKLWDLSNPSTREREALEYLALRKEYEPITGVKWSRNMVEGLLPPIDSSKKVCVFYSSSEIEFAVFGDPRRQENFRTQREAFDALLKSLDPLEWQVILRRHPYREERRQDPERLLWLDVAMENSAIIVGPESNVDSYALAKRADLVAHFNSSIGPEIIALECTPVITMGPNMWEEPDSLWYCNSTQRLLNFLQTDLIIRPVTDVLKWANYWNSFGEKFREVRWNAPRAYLGTERILPK